jgi:hypothetical protein
MPVPQIQYEDVSWERMTRAVEKIRERLLRSTSALEKAGIPYAVVGGSAVAAWVSRVDEAAVRNTRDVDILLRPADLEAAAAALAQAGFIRRHAAGVEMFLDGPQGKPRDAVHVVLAAAKVRPEYLLPAPDVSESEPAGPFRVLSLEALVRMKLTSFRPRDQMHLIDLLDVGLVDESWCPRFPPELQERLRRLLAEAEET